MALSLPPHKFAHLHNYRVVRITDSLAKVGLVFLFEDKEAYLTSNVQCIELVIMAA